MTMPITADQIRPRKYRVKIDGQEIGRAELRAIRVADVRIDSAYQRDLSSTWVHQHMPFDQQQASAIVVSARAGVLFGIDGHHRLALAQASGIEFINAFVIEGLSQRDEARIFTRAQRERRNLTAHALYRADLVAQDPDTLAMERVVLAAGFRIGKNFSSPDIITAIDSLRYIQRYGGEDLLARTLEAVKKFWIGEEKALSGQVLKGLAVFLHSAGQQASFRRERLDRFMNATSPAKLLRQAQSVAVKHAGAPGVTPSWVAEAIQEGYDKLVPAGEEKLAPLTIGRRTRPKRAWTKS